MGRKNGLNARDGKLAIQPPKVVYAPKIANEIKDGTRSITDTKHKGRASYVEKAIQFGLYKQIAVCIQKYREAHQDSTYTDIYDILHSKFPTVFYIKPEKMFNSNISKIINSDELWREAYFVCEDSLISLAKIRISQELNKNPDDLDASFALKSYDILKKWQIEEKKLQIAIDDKNKSVNDNDIPTFVFKVEEKGE